MFMAAGDSTHDFNEPSRHEPLSVSDLQAISEDASFEKRAM